MSAESIRESRKKPQQANAETSMTLLDHLNELRRRLVKAAIALVATTSISFSVSEQFIELLTVPIGGLNNLQATEVTETLSVFIRVSLLAGVILAMPVIVYQLLMFILPGLTRNEKKWIYLAVPIASLLFFSGVLFTYFVMLPTAVPFLVNFLEGVESKPRISNYINFVTNMMFWIGVSFETPLLVFVLAKFKIVTASMLLRGWRIAVVVIAVMAAAITPTVDPFSMALMMIPLTLLYLISLLLAYLAR